MIEEKWVKIVNFPSYSVSDFGRIRSDYGRKSGTILKPYLDKDGYETYKLFENKKYSSVKGHRIVLLNFKPFDEELTVNHINGIKTDNRLLNLESLSIGDNHRHARRTNLIISAKGENQSRARLTNQQVLEIKKLILQGKSTSYILRHFGFNKRDSIISRIKSGSDWSSVTAWDKINNPIKNPKLIISV
jgi:NUMOD4 motif